MSRNRLPIFPVTSFSGGLNNIMSATKISDKESPSLLNIEFTENGLPSKRRGTDAYGNAPNTRVLGLGRLYYGSGPTRKQLQVSGTSLYEYISGTWTAISGKTYTASKLVNFVQARGSIYSHDGTNQMGKYDGTTLSTPTRGATGKFGVFYASRHVVSGNTSQTSRLYFSTSITADNFTGTSGTATAGTATTLTDGGQAWTTNEFQSLVLTIAKGTGAGQTRIISSNTGTVITVSTSFTATPDTTSQYTIEGGDTLDVAKDDGQAITGLGKFEEKLLVFKERSLYQLTFDTSGNPTVTLISASYGCISHRTIENVENDILFLARDGVRTVGYVPNIPGVLRTNLLSSKVRNEIDNINPTYYENCSSIYHESHYILSFPQGSSTTNNRILAFNFLYGAWTIWTGINANCFNQFIDTDNKEKLYYGADDEGQTYQMMVSNYSDGSGTAIDSSYYTKQFDLGNPNLQKGLVFVDVQVRSLTGTLSIDIIVDGSSTTIMASLSSTFSRSDGLRVFMLREAMLRQDAGSTASVVATDDVRRIYIDADARTVQVKVYNSKVNENFTLMGLWIGYQPRSPFDFDSSKVIY